MGAIAETSSMFGFEIRLWSAERAKKLLTKKLDDVNHIEKSYLLPRACNCFTSYSIWPQSSDQKIDSNII